jgi:hypothetical protein
MLSGSCVFRLVGRTGIGCYGGSVGFIPRELFEGLQRILSLFNCYGLV